MTERLADISARIEGVRQLGNVVNAMKGIAAARANNARGQVMAVDSYAATIANALSRVVRSAPGLPNGRNEPDPAKTGLLVFCAEQGFAGAFSERVLDSLGAGSGGNPLFLIGTRGLPIASARGFVPLWQRAMPSHTLGLPKFADRVTEVTYRAVADGVIDRLEVVFTRWTTGRPVVVRQSLFPLDLSHLSSDLGQTPLTQLGLGALIDSLGKDYFHAQVCKAALHAFAAENEARMEAMAAAGNQIARELETYQATLRRVRQEAITAEIIELSTVT